MTNSQLFHLNAYTLSVLRASNETDSTLLITGSTGTGKSHLAHVIHKASALRSQGKFSQVNLATLSENLIESELFGHERGAFTGADARRVGKLEICNHGTIFLDEIGELSPRLQAKLLDLIQYKKITPVGANREVELDVRIIAATNRNLEAAVKSGEFRADLYHRLNVFHIHLSDIALNPKAIMLFAKEFLMKVSQKTQKPIHGFSKEVEQVLKNYAFPGNIRELENMIEFAVAMENTQMIALKSLPTKLQEYARETLKIGDAQNTSEGGVLDQSTEQSSEMVSMYQTPHAIGILEIPLTIDFHECKSIFEKAYLEQALKRCSGQINLTSRRTGLNKVSLTEKIRRYQIDWRKIRHETLGPAIKDAESEELQDNIECAVS